MHNTNHQAAGALYIVATPIGNLEDITLRALRILKEVDHIAAEDTRHTRKLLNHFGIHTPLISYYREKERERGAQLIELLLNGENIALVSDAGTPAISDPGAILVQMAHEKNITVVPIPGPSALTAALSASGFTEGTFLFIGFPPPQKGKRKKLLTSLITTEHPMVFYESPKRVGGFLSDAIEAFGDRPALWARELTKNFEDLQKTTLSELQQQCSKSNERGEFVLIIGPAAATKAEGENLEELLIWYRDNSDLSMKDVCKRLAQDLGMSRSNIYQTALELWKNR